MIHCLYHWQPIFTGSSFIGVPSYDYFYAVSIAGVSMTRRGPKTRGPTDEKQWKEFDKLCAMQCTKDEIASWFDCSVDSIVRRVEEEYEVKFAVVYAEKKSKGKISLRRAQWQKAVDQKSVPMLIWLGKQYLGQTDKQDAMGALDDLVFTSTIGEGGQIVQTIKSASDWESQKTFNVKDSLKMIQEEAKKRIDESENKKKEPDEKAD